MGVRLLSYTASTSASDAVQSRLAALGAERAGRWRTQCTYFNPRIEAHDLQDLFAVQFGELPETQFLVTMPSSSSAGVVLDAGYEIGGVLEAMRTHSHRLKVTAEGGLHRCGDFTIRLGRVFLNESLAGTLVDVEYVPCQAAGAATGLLTEFLALLLPPAEREFCSNDDCYVGKLPRAFGGGHAACQFVALLRARLLGLEGSSGAAASSSSKGKG